LHIVSTEVSISSLDPIQRFTVPQKRSKGCASGHYPMPPHAGSLIYLDQIYTEARLLQEGAADVEYEVFVLKGGFADFQQLFRVSGFLNY
jgi:hypothetical protein